MDTKKHQLLDTWVTFTITGGGAPSVQAQNNVSSVTSDATQCHVTFQRDFAATTYAVFINILVAGVGWVGVYKSKAVGVMDFSIYELVAGNLIVPTGGATNCEISVLVKGYF